MMASSPELVSDGIGAFLEDRRFVIGQAMSSVGFSITNDHAAFSIWTAESSDVVMT